MKGYKHAAARRDLTRIKSHRLNADSGEKYREGEAIRLIHPGAIAEFLPDFQTGVIAFG